MRVYFTEIFKLFAQDEHFFLINQKLDTIIPINESLYVVLKEINLKKQKSIDEVRIRTDTLNILLYNRVLEVRI